GAVRMLRGEKLDERVPKTVAVEISTKTPAPAKTPLARRSRLGARIAAGEFAVSVELSSPSGGADLDKLKAQVGQLLDGGVDIVDIADGPRASARVANI